MQSYRKIIAFGNGGFVVSIPREWLRNNDLKKGDVLKMSVEKNKIVLSARKTQRHEEIIRDTCNYLKKIEEAYIHNTKTIHVIKKGDKTDIKKFVQLFAALEVVHENDSKITLRNYLDYKNIDLENVMRKTKYKMNTMLKEKNVSAIPEITKMCKLAKSLVVYNLEQTCFDTKKVLASWSQACQYEELCEELSPKIKIEKRLRV